jgi:transposase-like protein
MPAGRPTDYRPEYIERAKEMCISGATDAELAEEFDVSVTTLYNWRAKYPEFLQALKIPKEIADNRVERSLFERATGYTRESVKIFCSKDGAITQVPFLEHVPPDPTSMIFWLKNRKPDQWREKSELEVTGNLAETIAEARKRARTPD